MAEKILLKDLLFNKPKVKRLASELRRVYPAFKEAEFVRLVVTQFPVLELKARSMWIVQCLKRYLPDDYKRAIAIIIKALPTPNDPYLSDDDFGDFIYAPYAAYVARYGCREEYLSVSLDALYQITQRFSAEDAIRPFLNTFPKATLTALLRWTRDPHYHVRRLCSEGTRPKLPWSHKIHIPIAASLPILDRLFVDTTRFVTRSVANHLNDLSKLDPDLVIATLTRWRESKKQKPEEMDYITRHALRTLVKQGHPRALGLLGFSSTSHVRIVKWTVPRQVMMNTALEFTFTVASPRDTNVLVDYSLSFQNKAGKLSNKKVFKLTKLVLLANQPVTISKKHLLREHMTTRKLFRGRHALELQINGQSFGKRFFELV